MHWFLLEKGQMGMSKKWSYKLSTRKVSADAAVREL